MKFAIRIKSVFAIAGTLIFISLAVGIVAAQTTTEKRVQEIRRIEAEINRRVAEFERSDEHSEIFVIEVNLNRRATPYPAVGIYTSVTRLYYTYGDREKDPYPNTLFKVVAETRRSSATENIEVFYAPTGEMVLYSTKVDGRAAQRIFFSGARAVRVEKGGKALRLTTASATALVRDAIALRGRFERLFKSAFH